MSDNIVSLTADKALLAMAEQLVKDIKTGAVDGVLIFAYKRGNPVWDDLEGEVDAGILHLDLHVMMLELANAYSGKDD